MDLASLRRSHYYSLTHSVIKQLIQTEAEVTRQGESELGGAGTLERKAKVSEFVNLRGNGTGKKRMLQYNTTINP